MLEVNPFQYCRAGIKLSAGLSILLLFATPATAQSKELSDLAKARDANGNGVIEKPEAGGPIAANFDTIDTDKNGTLDGAEIRVFFQGGPLPAAAPTAASGGGSTELSERAKARDANGNGVIDKPEAGGPLAANFDTIDTDKNGTLDGAEISAFFQGGAGPGGRPTGPPASVVLDTVVEETIGQTAPVVGRFVAREAGPIAARIGGAVLEMNVEVGDRLATGDLLAVLDRERLQLERDRYSSLVTQQKAQLSTTRADLAKARNDLKRLEGIRKSAAFSQARFDDAVQEVALQTGKVAVTRAQMVQAENQLKRAERDLTDAEIRTPFPGVVSETHTEVGAYLSVGAPVATIINDTNLDIEADVPSNRLAGLTPGTVVGVRLDDGDRTTAQLRAIVPSENPRTRTRPVRFTPDTTKIAKALANNQSVTVLIPVGNARTAVTVSKDAIIERAGRMTVFVFNNGTAQPRPVTVGDGTGDRFVIRSGLKPGDQVVIRGNEQLRPGQRLIILKKDNVSANKGERG
ncbi:MAG: efflux RND transporter periplasmic adaptor subunit [Alphaproteobacteria bacterium]|nr:efflux RND transporter periplasmic adaptor subunit [Alphaproteobacteria bacterium]